MDRPTTSKRSELFGLALLFVNIGFNGVLDSHYGPNRFLRGPGDVERISAILDAVEGGLLVRVDGSDPLFPLYRLTERGWQFWYAALEGEQGRCKAVAA